MFRSWVWGEGVRRGGEVERSLSSLDRSIGRRRRRFFRRRPPPTGAETMSLDRTRSSWRAPSNHTMIASRAIGARGVDQAARAGGRAPSSLQGGRRGVALPHSLFLPPPQQRLLASSGPKSRHCAQLSIVRRASAAEGPRDREWRERESMMGRERKTRGGSFCPPLSRGNKNAAADGRTSREAPKSWVGETHALFGKEGGEGAGEGLHFETGRERGGERSEREERHPLAQGAPLVLSATQAPILIPATAKSRAKRTHLHHARPSLACARAQRHEQRPSCPAPPSNAQRAGDDDGAPRLGPCR